MSTTTTGAISQMYKPYPEYKDSGVRWLGEIPAHWEIRRIKAVLARNDGGVWGEDFDDDGTIVLRSTEQTVGGEWNIVDPAKRKLSASEYIDCCLREGDLVVTKSSGSSLHIGKTSIVTKEVAALNCCFSNFMQRLRVKPNVASQFVWYVLNGELGRKQFDYLSNTTTGLANLNGEIIGNVMISLPPLPDQAAIAAFLDRETARIDALIEKKQRLIELLQEKRAALISRTVTKGLDPNVPMKDCGIPWLGEIPKHWKLSRLKHVCERNFVGIAEAATFAYVDEGVPMLRSTDVRSDHIRTDDIRRIDREFAYRLLSKQLTTGDIVTVRTGNAGVSAIVPPEYHGGQCFTLVVSRPAGSHDGRYFCYSLNALPGQQQFAVMGVGTAQINISVPIVQNIVVCVPPLKEQKRIADWIEQEVAHWDALILKTRESIGTLREYRTALISAAVTGKIDVRKASAS